MATGSGSNPAEANEKLTAINPTVRTGATKKIARREEIMFSIYFLSDLAFNLGRVKRKIIDAVNAVRIT